MQRRTGRGLTVASAASAASPLHAGLDRLSHPLPDSFLVLYPYLTLDEEFHEFRIWFPPTRIDGILPPIECRWIEESDEADSKALAFRLDPAELIFCRLILLDFEHQVALRCKPRVCGGFEDRADIGAGRFDLKGLDVADYTWRCGAPGRSANQAGLNTLAPPPFFVTDQLHIRE
jgi:hypothetical protein